MSDIFISYKKEDAPRVEPIARALAEAGYDVWWDHRIPAGRTYRDVIGAALQSAKCIIVVWSKLSIGAQWVLDEADEGKRRNVLLPLMIDDVEIPYGFRQIEAARLVGWTGDRGDDEWKNALSAVEHFVGRAPGGPPRALNSPDTTRRPVSAPAPRRSSVGGLLIGAVAAALVVGALYLAWSSDMFGGGQKAPSSAATEVAEAPIETTPDPAATIPALRSSPPKAETSTRENPAEAPPRVVEQRPVEPRPIEVRPIAPRPVEPAPVLACYWLSNVTNTWQPMRHISTKDECFGMDSCDGGLGRSNGGCYKWAAGIDAPRQPW